MKDTMPSQEHKFLIALTRLGYNYGASLNRLSATLKQIGHTFLSILRFNFSKGGKSWIYQM